MLDQHDDEQLRTPSTCPRHPLYVGRCPLCAREHDDVGHAPAPPAPIVPPLGRVVATAEHVHIGPARFPADVPSATHCLHDVRPEQCPRCSPAPATPDPRPWSEIDARHRDAIVGMLSAAAAHQTATARVQRAAHTSAERIADTEARGEAYAAAVERLRAPVVEQSPAGVAEMVVRVWGPEVAQQAFAQAAAIESIQDALTTHELLRGNLATFAAAHDRDAEAYDERAAACGTGPDHDRNRASAERSRAQARLCRAVLAIGTGLASNVPHAESVRRGEEGGQAP